MERTIFALFDDYPAAQRTAAALENDGHARQGISLLAPDPRGDYAEGGAPGDTLAVSPVSVPGIGPAVVAGPFGSMLAQANGHSGGLIGVLTRLGFESQDARHYFESVRRGQAIVAVEWPEDGAPSGEKVLRKLGARAVHTTASPASGEGDIPAPAGDEVRDRVTVPVVEERLETSRDSNRAMTRVLSKNGSPIGTVSRSRPWGISAWLRTVTFGSRSPTASYSRDSSRTR